MEVILVAPILVKFARLCAEIKGKHSLGLRRGLQKFSAVSAKIFGHIIVTYNSS